MNSSGCTDPVGRVVPAEQRFRAGEGQVVEVVGRLVDEMELVVGERGAELALELAAA